ncbi:MAG: hypothetical protein ABI882_05410 [Acidobacteriota bacterium]
MESLVDRADVRPNSLDSHVEMIGDLLVRKALNKALQHFPLAAGKVQLRRQAQLVRRDRRAIPAD